MAYIIRTTSDLYNNYYAALYFLYRSVQIQMSKPNAMPEVTQYIKLVNYFLSKYSSTDMATGNESAKQAQSCCTTNQNIQRSRIKWLHSSMSVLRISLGIFLEQHIIP